MLNPTSDESKRKDKLKKEKNEHTISQPKQNEQEGFVHLIVNITKLNAHDALLLLLYVLNPDFLQFKLTGEFAGIILMI